MRALRVGLTLALGAGLGAAAERWRRQQTDAQEARGLLGRLPVLPVAAAAELPAVPVLPGGPGGRGPGELAKYGLPGVAQLKSRESYVLCYDPRTRGALWVIEQLRPERLRGDGDRRSCDFREDDSVHAYHRATNADYRGSGFDRGHLAAAANHRWSQKAMDDTFYLSNVAPQVAPGPPRTSAAHRQVGRPPSARLGPVLATHARPWREEGAWGHRALGGWSEGNLNLHLSTSTSSSFLSEMVTCLLQ
jgi:endonuclease G